MGFLFCVGGMEVNASLGQGFSTSTKRCAGVIPAVMMYQMIIENHNANFEDVKKFLRVAGITGVLFIKRATVSAVMGGCPEEIEVSSAMAASA